MKLWTRKERNGNGIAIGLSALAVVLAATGTAVAVAPSTFSIADHAHPGYYLQVDKLGRVTTLGTASGNAVAIADRAHPSQYLKVDSSGRVGTTAQTANVTVALSQFTGGTELDNFVVQPTTAQFAVTHIGATALPTNTGTYTVSFLQTPTVDAGTCNTQVSSKDYSHQVLAPGGNVDTDYATPLLVKGVSSAKYCLDIYLHRVSGTANTTDQVFVQFDGYVTSGSYTGAGAKTTNSATQRDGKVHTQR